MDSKVNGLQITTLLENTNKVPTATQYIQLAQSINSKKYFKILKEGTKIHPASLKIQARILKYYLKNKQPKTALKHLLTSRPRTSLNNTSLFYQHCATTLVKQQRISDALHIVKKGLILNNGEEAYIKFASKFALKFQDWSLAKEAFELRQHLNPSTEAMFDLAICYQVAGKTEESNHLIQQCINDDPIGYEELFEDQFRKYTLYTNNQSTIELYKYIEPSSAVVATFDTIDKTIERIPFAYNLIKKKKMDILALRRDNTKNFHQDLSRETYIEATTAPLQAYTTKFAYGTSLGGYCALYFGSTIKNAHILAMAPRNSAIVGYGSENLENCTPQTHTTPHLNNNSQRINILFDPLNTIDAHYLKNEVFASYPQAKIMKLPFAGHRLPKYLSQTKQLKPLVDQFLNKQPLSQIQFGKKRQLSSEYFWVISEKCFAHKHLKWALDFANHSLALSPSFDRPLIVKTQTLMALSRIEEAIATCHQGIIEFPTQVRFTILLAECYLLANNKKQAVHAIEQQLNKMHSKKLERFLEEIRA